MAGNPKSFASRGVILVVLMAIRAGLMILIVTGVTAVAFSSWTGQRASEPSEEDLVREVQRLKQSNASVMPNDKFPRPLRLASALHALGAFYSRAEKYDKADTLYEKTFAILSNDKTDAGIDYYRFHADKVAKDYLRRQDLRRAKKYIDIALEICRTNERERSVMHTVLATLADWYTAQKLWAGADTVLIEAIQITGEFAYPYQLQLIGVYLSSDQLEKAERTIGEASKSKYADSRLQNQKAALLRAQNKMLEAAAAAAEAKVLEARERNDRRAEE